MRSLAPRAELALWAASLSQVVLLAQESLIVIQLSQVNLIAPLDGALAVEAVVVFCNLVS